MKILLTGATGYIGKRLLPLLIEQGHHVFAAQEIKQVLYSSRVRKDITVIEVDFLKQETLSDVPNDIDAAYYLMHSMSSSSDKFDKSTSAHNFVQRINNTNVQQVYLAVSLTKILCQSIWHPEKCRDHSKYWYLPYDDLRAGIIVGSGSASLK
jgi:uncharacterized protein YbjT (DUF2867 family)